MNDALAWQMFWQCTARRSLALEAFDLDLCAGRRGSSDLRLRLGLCGILFQLTEAKFELFENGTALGGLAVPLVAQLGDGELHLLDQQRPRFRLGLGGKARRFRGENHRLERRNVVRKRISGQGHATSKAQSRAPRPANVRRESKGRVLSRGLRTPRALRHPPIDAFEQIAELRRRDRHRAVRRQGPDEASALQPLRIEAHALAVVPQNLDQRAAAAAEHEQMPTMRIVLEFLLHQQRQSVEALAHVGVAGCKPYMHAAQDRNHRRRSFVISAAAIADRATLSTWPVMRMRAPLANSTSITPSGAGNPAGAISTAAKSAGAACPAHSCRRQP